MNAVYFVVRCIAFAFIFIGKVFKFWYYDALDRLSTRHLRSKYWEQRILTCSAIIFISLFNTLSKTAQLKKEKQEKEEEAIIAKMYTNPEPSKMKRKINL